MSIEQIQIANITIDVLRKDIKNMHLAVYPPYGKVKVAVPGKTDLEVIRLFAISKYNWLKKNINSFQEQEREAEKKYINGETHYFLGRRYLLELQYGSNKHEVSLQGKKMILHVRKGTSIRNRKFAVQEWYRNELKKVLLKMLPKWESKIGVKTNATNIKRMRTKWGSCNTQTKSILLNLELAKKPIKCFEYILVHELIHLLERNHNNQFIAYMHEFMPTWQSHRDELNNLPVPHYDWGY